MFRWRHLHLVIPHKYSYGGRDSRRSWWCTVETDGEGVLYTFHIPHNTSYVEHEMNVGMCTLWSWYHLFQDTRRIRSIAIETGIQNTGIAILIMKFSLPAPDGDLAMVSPVVVAAFTPAPLIILLIMFEVYKRCFKKKKTGEDDEEETQSVTFSRIPSDETDASQLMDHHDDHRNGDIQTSTYTWSPYLIVGSYHM